MDLDKSKTVIVANQHVLLRLPSDGLKIAHLREDGAILLGKFGAFNVATVLGHPFGTTFEIVDEGNAVPVKSLTSIEDAVENEMDLDQELTKDQLTKYFEVSAESNQDIINIGLSIQKLDSKQIDELKRSGALSETGQRIIEQIIAGHGGFDKKTVFSQQKYLRRKQQKFLRRFQVEYLGALQLLQYYIEKDLGKVLDMSEETLGFLLSAANVRPGGNYVVLDDTAGVVVYAMMERMAGQGLILLVHENEHANLAAMRHLDYTEDYQRSMIKTLSWLQFIEPENEKIDWVLLTQAEVDQLKPSKRLQHERRLRRAHDINDALARVTRGNFDALVAATTLSIPLFLPYVVPRIGGSRPLVFYSPFKEALLETQHALQADKRVLAPSIFETKVRAYQTIQGRLHPLMTLRGYGGYVLAGTRVFPAEDIQAVGKGTRKKPKVDAAAAAETAETAGETATEAASDSAMSVEPEARE